MGQGTSFRDLLVERLEGAEEAAGIDGMRVRSPRYLAHLPELFDRLESLRGPDS